MTSSWEKQSLGVASGSLPLSWGDHFNISWSHLSSLRDKRLPNTSLHIGENLKEYRKKKKNISIFRKLPVEIVWLWQMFTEMNFPCEVLIHHNVVVALQHHFIVPEEHTAELKLKYVTG